MSYNKEKEVALHAIKKAAVICRAVQAEITPDVIQKKDRSPVTVADFASQAIVCKFLKEAFPDDAIVAEEDSSALAKKDNAALLSRLKSKVATVLPDVDEDVLSLIDRGNHSGYSQRFWTLDPIDGTKGFLRKEQYAISLALIEEGKIVVGALACPNLIFLEGGGFKTGSPGSAFIAVKGEGAVQLPLNDSKDSSNGKALKIRVSNRNDPAQIRRCESVEKAHSSHDDSARIAQYLKIESTPVRLDSQAKYAVVAKGEAEVYLRLPGDNKYREKIWDHAGGLLVTEEAGGKVTDIDGKPLDFTKGNRLEHNRGVVVTNGLVHKSIIDAISTLKI
jgi:3'(2'), 5'-bisphosphate nucleotidase